jgi:QueF-like protein
MFMMSMGKDVLEYWDLWTCFNHPPETRLRLLLTRCPGGPTSLKLFALNLPPFAPRQGIPILARWYRNQGIFYEVVTNKILDDFVAVVKPLRCELVGKYTPRGGISTNVTVTYKSGTM